MTAQEIWPLLWVSFSPRPSRKIAFSIPTFLSFSFSLSVSVVVDFSSPSLLRITPLHLPGSFCPALHFINSNIADLHLVWDLWHWNKALPCLYCSDAALLLRLDDLSCDCFRVFQEVQDMLSEMRAREGAPEGMPSLANLYSSRDYKRSWHMMPGGLMVVATEEE